MPILHRGGARWGRPRNQIRDSNKLDVGRSREQLVPKTPLMGCGPQGVHQFCNPGADSTCSFDIGIAKDLSAESLDGCIPAPGTERQASFAAGLIEKGFAVPILFHGYLGQQQTTVSAL